MIGLTDKRKSSEECGPAAAPSAAQVRRWHRALLRDGVRLAELEAERGLRPETVEFARIGWDARTKRYMIPIYNGSKVVNVRRYRPNPPGRTQKFLNTKGCGSPVRIYSRLPEHRDAEHMLIVEGELDALLAAQEFGDAGLDVEVVSGTGGAANPPRDVERLRHRNVCIAYDCDAAGSNGADKLARKLHGVAASVRVADLGLSTDGADVTDWFMNVGRTAERLWTLCMDAPVWSPDDPVERRDSGKLLAIAVDQKVAEEGSRNSAGFWLACQLRDERYTEDEAETVLREFQEAVAGQKSDPYTVAEALDSLQSAYAQPPRDAVGALRAMPMKFFEKDIGLKVRTLAETIEAHGAIGSDDNGELYSYVDGAWLRGGDREVHDRTRILLDQKYRPAHGQTVAKWFSVRPPVITDRDANTTCLNLPNGLLDWRTGRLHDHDPEVASLARIPVDWDPDATCPHIDSWVREVLPEDSVDLFYEIAGYMLYNGNPLHKAILLHGTGPQR